MIPKLKEWASRLLGAELWIILICVGVSFLFTQMLLVSVIIAGVFCLLRLFARGKLSRRTPLDVSILLLVMMSALSLWLTSLSPETRTQVLRLWAGLALFYAAVNWTDSFSRLRISLYLGSGLALALAGLSIIGVDWELYKLPIIPATIYSFLPSMLSDLFHRNVMAGYLILFLLPMLGVLLFAWRELPRLARSLLIVVASFVAILLLLTQSRGALLAFSLTFGLLLLLRWRWTWFVAALASLSGLAAVFLIGTDRILSFISSIISLQGMNWRIEMWSRAVYMIQDFPVFGIGMGLFQKVVDTLYPFFTLEPGSIPHAHNILLQVAIDLGLPGLIAWVSIILSLLFFNLRVYQLAQRSNIRWLAGLASGFFLSLIALLAHGMLDAVTWGLVRGSPLVWFLWGISISAGLLSINHSPDESHPSPGFNTLAYSG